MAEYLDLDDNRTGGRVVYCSGLENLAGKAPETAEMADFCGLERAPDAMFANCSADSDGAQVGTPDEEPEDAYGRTGTRVECWECYGSGDSWGETCVSCGGYGWINEP